MFPRSKSALHPPCQDEEAGDRLSRRQLHQAQVHGQREPPAGNRVAEGRAAADGAGGGRGPSEEVDPEPEEPRPGAERQIHLQSVQPGRRNQRHIQSGGHP